MTNLEMVLKTDEERFFKEIAEKICFCASKHTVKVIRPPLCAECDFGEVTAYKCKCHTDEIIEWLKSECEEV